MIAIVAPCLNEHMSITTFLKKPEAVLITIEEEFHVIIVDDCSQDNSLSLLSDFSFKERNIDKFIDPGRFMHGLFHRGCATP